MRILFLSESGDGLGIAERFAREGHDVIFWIADKDYEYAGQGLMERPKGWRNKVVSCDLVICDMVGFGHFAKRLSMLDVPSISCNPFGDILELDRAKQQDTLVKLGVPTPNTWSFSGPGDARDLIGAFPSNGLVVKPSGNDSTAKTRVCDDPDTYAWALEDFGTNDSMIVQEVIKGIEISTEGWFNGHHWLEGTFTHTFEEKRLMDGGLGPNTGCMGNVVIPAPNVEYNKFVGYLKKLGPFLASIDYRGPIDINFMVNENELGALEITARMGYDAIEALHQAIGKDLLELINVAANGQDGIFSIPDANKYTTVIRGFVPPYPMGSANIDMRGLPISLPENMRHYYLTDVYKDGNVSDDSQYRWAASDGVIVKAAYSAPSLKGSINMAYKAIEKVRVLDLGYRHDIGQRVEGAIKNLTSWGYF